MVTAILTLSSLAQPTHAIADPEKQYKEAKELFVKEQYALAYPLLRNLKADYPDNRISNHTYINDDVNYYVIVCALKLEQATAANDAKQYIHLVANEPRRQMMSFHLAQYYFKKADFSNAIDAYERAGLDNLSNTEIADAKFEKAYCYFNLKQFSEAKPLFDEVHQMTSSKYYIPANYYYGFICYYDRQYNEALKAFKLIELEPDYVGIVPYYIAEIFYFQGKKEEALKYGESVLGRGGVLYYDKEMKLLLGQIYFEKKNFQKALPLLQDYANQSDKVSKEVIYELSYCNYEAGQWRKAIDGFKQLSNEKDSMGQNSMYLLGDCYLKIGEKANARNAFQYCAYNSSNAQQQQVSRFHYAKLSYELGYQDIALKEMKSYLHDYPGSEYEAEAKEIMVSLLANTSNYAEALILYEYFAKPTASMQKVYPRILFGRAVELINDQQLNRAEELLNKLLLLPTSAITAYANFWKAEIAYRQDQYDLAIRQGSLFLEANVPALGEANTIAAKYNLGYGWLKKENYKQALSYFEPISKSNTTATPLEQDAFVRAADCYYMNRDFAKADAMYSSVVNNALPLSDYALLQRAMIAGVKSSVEKIKVLNSIPRLYPNSSLVPDVNMEIADTYMGDEKFSNAIPYLTNIINLKEAGGLKPKAYLKLGLSNYNIDNNKEALKYYQVLIQTYPQSAEADEAMDNIRNIYVEEGRPNDYVDLMQKNGKTISVTEADSLTYVAAQIKYDAGDCTAAINGYNNYLSRYANGAYALEANYFRSDCYNKAKDWNNALIGYTYVNQKGQNKYFEKASLTAAQINYFELKNYAAAKTFFQSLLQGAMNQDNRLEALRGIVRCFFQLKEYTAANDAAKELLGKKNISTDDKSIGFLVLGKSQQLNNDCAGAILSFKSCAAINKSAWGAEARYEIANCHFTSGNMSAAEKAAMATIKETGSYDNWVTKSYILLGDIFMQQKDYFNAKATYESVAKNASIPELKSEAQQKFEAAAAAEKENSKISN